MIGSEARAKTFNVLLAGGVNLTRDPWGGRNFEYLGEDLLLAGVMAGAAIRGVESNHIVSTIKHFALNPQETGRHVMDARIAPADLRESDLLAFQIAIEQGRPGSVMCAYNKVNRDWACENPPLLNDVLRRDWGYKGWVMSDWGAVHSTVKAAMAGLDQQSGQELDKAIYFGPPLAKAVSSGAVPAARLDAMVTPHPLRDRRERTLRQPGADDRAADRLCGQRGGRAAYRRGRHGAAQERPQPAPARRVREADRAGRRPCRCRRAVRRRLVAGPLGRRRAGRDSADLRALPRRSARMTWHASSPLNAFRARAAGAERHLCRRVTIPPPRRPQPEGADLVVVFATQWQTEAQDVARSRAA